MEEPSLPYVFLARTVTYLHFRFLSLILRETRKKGAECLRKSPVTRAAHIRVVMSLSVVFVNQQTAHGYGSLVTSIFFNYFHIPVSDIEIS